MSVNVDKCLYLSYSCFIHVCPIGNSSCESSDKVIMSKPLLNSIIHNLYFQHTFFITVQCGVRNVVLWKCSAFVLNALFGIKPCLPYHCYPDIFSITEWNYHVLQLSVACQLLVFYFLTACAVSLVLHCATE